MARVTNVTSMDLEVPVLGNRVVKAGETVEVDDALVGTYEDEHGDTIGNVWPETNWEVQDSDDQAEDEPADQEEEG